MSLIFYALERAGAQMEGNEDRAWVKLHGQIIECRLVEKLRKIKLPLSKFDVQYQTASFVRGYRVGLEVTGMLAFEIETYLRSQAQQVWKETDKCPLEHDIPAIVTAIVNGAAILEAWDEERKAAQARGERQRELREKIRREAVAEEARWQLLVSLAAQREQAQKVGAFVRSIAKAQSDDLQTTVGDRTLGQWLEWLELNLERRSGANDIASLFRKVSAIVPSNFSEGK